jgi:mannan polymerase II complex MNN11 subunit
VIDALLFEPPKMHFALPPRKSSQPPIYARTNSSAAASLRRRKQLQLVGYVVLSLLTLYLILSFTLLSDKSADDLEDGSGAIEGHQDIVLVTIFDNATMSEDYMKMVRANREDYAARHGKHPTYVSRSLNWDRS